jgi:hypothetical protein
LKIAFLRFSKFLPITRLLFLLATKDRSFGTPSVPQAGIESQHCHDRSGLTLGSIAASAKCRKFAAGGQSSQ